MATATVRQAVRELLTGAWTVTPLSWENENFDRPDPPSPWLRVLFEGYAYDQASIGAGAVKANRWVEEGAVLIEIMVPVGTGAQQAATYAEDLATIFMGAVLPGTVRFRSMRIGEGFEKPEDDEDGNWWALSFRAEWIRG